MKEFNIRPGERALIKIHDNDGLEQQFWIIVCENGESIIDACGAHVDLIEGSFKVRK